ncbi:3-hydroxyacyl-CoA dehydrogenase NAD-binding domain-containing protein [Desulfotomaculum copahuensis]|uniref:3-hydroxybutyryl-CoA dehydrogenase n=1 Tax=Desulfotomaculum copahuensis TaxID=1838280 RepID=A0A1B7LAH5_9FIRM|nr:3-hydroxyacyl-CoA dehydrogenase NAD-binding domain-containing protein [Desulfotomaculum copahuensis]OAT79329.1 3-hydroxybutyryl-CoA dehydrogenase [Desulfotomaculum copahuensis]
MSKIKTVAVVGAGTMGRYIAQAVLEYFLRVNLIDISEKVLDSACQMIRDGLFKRVESGKMSMSKVDNAFDCLGVFLNLEEGVFDADLVIEAVSENLPLKKEMFKKLDGICPPSTILATNTSGIPITSIARITNYRERVVGTHFYNPAHLIPLVEVVRSDYTEKKVVEEVMSFLRSLGKKPILVNKDIPGFIGNRLQHAITREALSLLQNGVASARDIDDVVRYTLGLRFAHTGPLEQRDLNGLDVHLSIAEYLYPTLEDSKEPLTLLKEKVAEGKLGLKTGHGIYDWSNYRDEDIVSKKNRQLVRMLEMIETLDHVDI